MADQTQGAPGARPHRQLGADKPKHGGAVHRATSECLRVADADKPQAARKISSFQITSVTVGSRASADAGEDSADDLDESHTDDISRITDLENETPSFSEDTFSKDEVFYNASSASLGCAPVIPTSSQYGLAIVGPDGQAQHHPSADVGDARIGVALADAGAGAAAEAGAPKPSEGAREGHEQVRNERFKVVKIESTEPFRRGRWTCMDYLDHTTAPPTAPTANSVDCQPDPAAPDAGSVAADAQQDDQAPPDAPAKQVAKELQAPEAAAHAFPAASPGQSLTQPVMLAAAAQSPPMELPQQQQMAQAPAPAPQQHAQSVSHVSLGASPHPQQQPQPAQIPQSFPSHQLQQAIAQAQGMPQMQQMQMHPQLPNQQMQQIQSQQIQNQQIQNQQIQNQQIQNQQIQNQQIQNQQMQNQQAQIQQLQGQQHLGHGQSQMTNMQQMPQMQQLQPQGQMQQMSGQQAQIQHMQMQQMPGQQMPGQQMPGQQMANQQMTNQQMTNQQMTNQQMTNQQMTNQQMSNQQQISNQQVSGQQPLHQMHPQQPQMQTIPQQPHHIQAQQPQLQHMQNQQQLHPMQGGQQHQMQAGQAHQQHQMQPHMQQMSQMGGQGQTMPQLHQTGAPQGPMHGQMQQPGIGGYGGQQVAQSPNPQAMMQPTPQHLGQQAQAPQPIVQAQHGVPQFYQQAQLAQQGQSLPQDAMAGVVGSQLPNGLQGGQAQGATLPSTLQGIGALQMMTQPPQSVPMIDGGQTGMQMPVADPMYMQAPNVQQQLPPMMSQQTAPQPGQGQQAHLATQMTMSHQMPSQQHAIPNQQHAIPGQQHPQIPGQTAVVNQASMQSVPVQQMPQVSMASVVQQNPQPMMQSIVGNQQGVPMQAPSVHGVPASVVQSQTNMHGQVSVPMGGFAGVPGSMQQSSLPSMTQTNMTAQIGMQNPVNGQLDMGMGQQTVCPAPAVGQTMMSGTNSPVVPLPVGSSIGYAQNPAGANPADGQNFGSPVGATAAHSTGGLVGGGVGLPGGEATESGGGTPASDGTQIDNNEGKDDLQIGQSSEDSESLSGLAMALGGTSNATSRPPSRAASPPCTHPADTHHHSASGTSAVAIDNKIEQAMDLVKSHLMFAVREEVEVLKEKIAELMEKINQLEIENSVLRAHATQETLAQLAAPPAGDEPPRRPRLLTRARLRRESALRRGAREAPRPAPEAEEARRGPF